MSFSPSKPQNTNMISPIISPNQKRPNTPPNKDTTPLKNISKNENISEITDLNDFYSALDEQDIDKSLEGKNIVKVNDLLGPDASKPITLSIMDETFNNFFAGKISTKSYGVIKSYAANTNQGIIRDYNEDRVSIIINITKPNNYNNEINWPKASYFAVFDGHGGNKCADFLRDNLLKLICNNNFFPTDIPKAIKTGFADADQIFLEYAIKDGGELLDNSGSCGLILLVVNNILYIGNVGDSRCLISQKNGKIQKDVTRDHKPNYPYEKERILLNGGKIYQTQTPINQNNDILNNNTILMGPHRVSPGNLSVSRTVGDAIAKLEILGGNKKVVISEPDIYVFDLSKDDVDYIFLACDGVYDQLTSRDVFKCIEMIIEQNKKFIKDDANKTDLNITSGKIVDFVLKASMSRKSFDNVTCLFIAFKDFLNNDNDSNKDDYEELMKIKPNVENVNDKEGESNNEKISHNSKIDINNKEIEKEENITKNIIANKKLPKLQRNKTNHDLIVKGILEPLNNNNSEPRQNSHRNEKTRIQIRSIPKGKQNNIDNNEDINNDKENIGSIGSKFSDIQNNNKNINKEYNLVPEQNCKLSKYKKSSETKMIPLKSKSRENNKKLYSTNKGIFSQSNRRFYLNKKVKPLFIDNNQNRRENKILYNLQLKMNKNHKDSLKLLTNNINTNNLNDREKNAINKQIQNLNIANENSNNYESMNSNQTGNITTKTHSIIKLKKLNKKSNSFYKNILESASLNPILGCDINMKTHKIFDCNNLNSNLPSNIRSNSNNKYNFSNEGSMKINKGINMNMINNNVNYGNPRNNSHNTNGAHSGYKGKKLVHNLTEQILGENYRIKIPYINMKNTGGNINLNLNLNFNSNRNDTNKKKMNFHLRTSTEFIDCIKK